MPTRPASADTPARRGPARAWAAAAALLLGALCGVWIAGLSAPLPREAPAGPLQPAPPPQSSATVAVAAPPVPAAARRLRPAAAPPAPRQAPAAAAAPGPERVEVCGWGHVELPADDPFPLQRIPAASRRAALDEAEAWMSADADTRVRAAALLLGSRGPAGRVRTEQLARLAAGSQDAVVYAFALQACRGGPEAGACTLLGSAQAAQIEPGNAQPWLVLAAEAAARQDGEAEHDAMRHAALAQHVTPHGHQLALLVAQALAAPQAALQRTLALGVALGLQDAAWLAPGAGGVAQARAYCLVELAHDDAVGAAAWPQRGASCRPLAQLLLQHGRGVAELGAGLAIARHWGVPAAELAPWQQEHDALLVTAAPLADGHELGCAEQRQRLAWLKLLASDGERAALRAQLAASGHSIAQWSARHRRSLALAQAAVAAAAEPDGAEPPR